jgi:xylulokinase
LDDRAGEQAEVLKQLIPEMEFYHTTGLPEISGALPLAKLMWLRQEEPEIYEKAHKFLLVEDYLLYHLTGRFVSEKALQTSTGWFDLNTDGLWKKGLEAAGIDPRKLPEILECGEKVGPLTENAARMLGLEPGIPVVTGAMDQTAAALAGGCVKPGTVTETTGSALVLAACTDAPSFAEGHHVTVYRHALPGKFIYLPIGNTGGMALKWFRDQFCKDLAGGEAGFDAINEMVSAVPAGCEGLTFLPFLSGSVDPDNCPEATACFFGARLSTTRAHFARAVMESIANLVRDFFEMLQDLGCPVREVYSLGGGSRSPVWLQIKADVCNRSFRPLATSEATAMGAAILAGWGAGIIEPGTVPEISSAGAYLPKETNREAYDEAYARYKKLYRAVKPLY